MTALIWGPLPALRQTFLSGWPGGPDISHQVCKTHADATIPKDARHCGKRMTTHIKLQRDAERISTQRTFTVGQDVTNGQIIAG